jgi:pimeloyl-ACP methyl ester carboxylesterase
MTSTTRTGCIWTCAPPNWREVERIVGLGPSLLTDHPVIEHGWRWHMSERGSVDLSYDAQVATALAVADAMRADRFCMFGASQGGQIAAALAARFPDRVESLVLYGMCASGADLAPPELRDSIVSLVRANWGLGLKMMTAIFIPDPGADDIDALARLQRESASAAVGSRLLDVYYSTDIRDLLPAIRARTAILHREGTGQQASSWGRM